MSVAEFKAYERYWDNRRNAASTISTAVIEGEFKGKKAGLEKGIKQGLKKGKKEGLKEGKELGKKEGRKKAMFEVAKNMLSEGFSVKEIAKVTGLAENEVPKLK